MEIGALAKTCVSLPHQKKTIEDPITEDSREDPKGTLKKTLSLRILSPRTLKKTLLLRTLKKTLSLRTVKRTLSLRTLKNNLSLSTLKRTLSMTILKRTLSLRTLKRALSLWGPWTISCCASYFLFSYF